MRKHEILVENEKSAESISVLKDLPYIKEIRETENIDIYTLASEKSLSEDWLIEEADELQKLYEK